MRVGWGKGAGVAFGILTQDLFRMIKEGLIEEVMLEYRLKGFMSVFGRHIPGRRQKCTGAFVKQRGNHCG